MGRTYAGILGSLAMITVIVRGLLTGGDAAAVAQQGVIALAAFAAIGLAVGSLADWIVQDAVNTQFSSELDKRQASSGS